MNNIQMPTILIVDHVEAGRSETARIISAAGFAVMDASTGYEALERARMLPAN